MSNVLETDRLLLRGWRDDDLDDFAAICADPEVMQHYPKSLSRDESDTLVERIRQHFLQHGFGLWAAERRPVESTDLNARFMGFIGIIIPRFEAHFTPCIEIGWRLARDCWGYGYATEGAQAATKYAFDVLGVDELVAMTVPANTRSRRVMDKLGMLHNSSDDFEHPLLPEGHALRHHVLYRLTRAAYLGGQRIRELGVRGD